MSNLCGFQRGGTSIYAIEAPGDAALRTINSYLVVHAAGLYLVDAGLDNAACWEAFMRVMHELDYSIRDLKGIILTHHHPDHVGLVHRIRKVHAGVSVYAHPLAVPYITHDKVFLKNRIRFFERLYGEMDGMPDGEKQIEKFKSSLIKSEAFRIEGDITLIQEGDTVIDFTVLHVPGHAPDHIMLYDPKRQWAIAGDLVIEHMSTNAIIEPDAGGNLLPTLTQQLSSLQRGLSLKADIWFTGHGKAVRDPQTVIRSKIARIEQKLERIRQFMREGYDTAGSMARLYDKEIYENQFFLVISEVIGLLDHLERAGLVYRRKIDGIYHYGLIEEG